MISIELSPDIERQFLGLVNDDYDGNFRDAIVTFLRLHQKYGWKVQLQQNVDSVRAEVSRRGGVNSEDIDNAIRRYRQLAVNSDV